MAMTAGVHWYCKPHMLSVTGRPQSYQCRLTSDSNALQALHRAAAAGLPFILSLQAVMQWFQYHIWLSLTPLL